MLVAEFMANLASSFLNSIPAKQTQTYIQRRLGADNLSEQALQRLFDRIAERCTYYPVWAVIDQSIGELSLRSLVGTARHWVTFKDPRGRSWAMRCPNPEYPPATPAWASEVSIAIDSPLADNYDDVPRDCLTERLPLSEPGRLQPVNDPMADVAYLELDISGDRGSGGLAPIDQMVSRLARVQDTIDWDWDDV